MPNGRTLQVASVHHYRDQWAKAFDIKYENLEGTQLTYIKQHMGCLKDYWSDSGNAR